jgi:hypothetical protein
MAVRLSALRAGRLPFIPRKTPGTHFCKRLNATGRSKSIEKPSDLIGTRTRDIPSCSIVPQPTTLPHAPEIYAVERLYLKTYVHFIWKSLLSPCLHDQIHNYCVPVTLLSVYVQLFFFNGSSSSFRALASYSIP